MNLLSKIFGTKNTEKDQRYFCQQCWKDVTLEGGDVTNDGRIYCHGDKPSGEARCIIQATFTLSEPVSYNYHGPQELAKLVKRGELTRYSKDIRQKIQGTGIGSSESSRLAK